MIRLFFHTLLLYCLILPTASAQQKNENPAGKPAKSDAFLTQIAPAFEQSCVRCHNASKSRGGLSLETLADLQKGSENGSVLEPGNPAESRLLEVLLGDKPEMPQKEKPLEKTVVKAVEEWIRQGAPWPADLKLVDKSQNRNKKLWSFEPIAIQKLPEISEESQKWARNPIDYFIASKHELLKFQPAKQADKKTLIRRLYYDLVGLPPSPEAVQQFLNDDRPDAYEKLVDQLLESPGYGERWARHWLDVIHYGETHGYDKDKIRLQSWPYRDYVIQSLNDDKPYARFIQEQIAGDALFPENPDAIRALGFLSAGPWDFIGHAEVAETKTDGKIARHLDRDDMVGTAVSSLLSLTVQCAQCHDHKFDPILQADYYRLQAVFAGVDRAERPYFATGEEQKRYESLHQRQLHLIRSVRSLDQQVQTLAGLELQKWNDRINVAKNRLANQRNPQYGYHSAIETNPFVEKWVQLTFPEPVEIAQIQVAPCSDDFNQIGDGFGFPPRFKIEITDQKDFAGNIKKIVDQTNNDLKNPGIQIQNFAINAPQSARTLRFTATKLAPRLNDYIFALAEIVVLDRQGNNIATKATISALDSIEAAPRWQKTNITDGFAPSSIKTDSQSTESPESLEKLKRQWLESKVPVALLTELSNQQKELQSVEAEIQSIPKPSQVFAATVHHGSGAFTGTGASGGVPRPIFRLNRGDVNQPRELIQPGTIESIQFAKFALNPDESENESARRAALATWMTDTKNPLLWRSIVNRVWQYHFGRGIVDTTGDFGHMGGNPSHPELLDYLAQSFRDSGGKMKSLHRLIVTSATYRQQSVGDTDDYSAQDSQNVYLWRQNRRKLEAEAIRDSILAVAGKLDRKMGGPSFQDFVVTHPEHSPHFEYDKADPADPALHRRSIYRLIVRSQPQPFLTTMDCADPSIRVDKRNESVSSAQALAQWNEALVLAMAGELGKWIETQPGDVNQKVESGFEKCLVRKPSHDELQSLVSYTKKFGYPSLARLLLNLNEFSFVD